MDKNASMPANSFSEAADFSVYDLELTDVASFLDATYKVFKIFMRSERTISDRYNAYADLDLIDWKLIEAVNSGIISGIGSQKIVDLICFYRVIIDLETRY